MYSPNQAPSHDCHDIILARTKQRQTILKECDYVIANTATSFEVNLIRNATYSQCLSYTPYNAERLNECGRHRPAENQMSYMSLFI